MSTSTSDNDVAEVNGLSALTDTPQKAHVNAVIDPVNGVVLDTDTGVVSELRDSRTGRFVKGHAPLAGGGRPKKGESLLDYTEKLVNKAANKQAVAEAKLDRLLDRGSVGNRAWAEYRDTYFGKPADTLVLSKADSPLLMFMSRRNDRIVEGESRVVDDNAP